MLLSIGIGKKFRKNAVKRLKSTIFYNKTSGRQSFLQKSGCLFSKNAGKFVGCVSGIPVKISFKT